MKIWIHVNGVQEGPFDEASLPLHRITPQTPVWYEACPTGSLPVYSVTAEILLRAAQQQTQQQTEVTVEQLAPQSRNINIEPQAQSAQYGYSAPKAAAAQAPAKCPPSYLVWSILFTVLCLNPVGIGSIISGMRVSRRFGNYDYEGAKRASEATEWWLMVTIVTSIIAFPFMILINL